MPETAATDTDWARIQALSDEERMAGALADADVQPLTTKTLARASRVLDGQSTATKLSTTAPDTTKRVEQSASD